MISLAKKEYVSYFRKNIIFNPNKIETNLECNPNFKPISAFWGSPSNAEYGWKEWCESEDFGNYDFNNPKYWKLKEGSKILNIDIEAVKNHPNSKIKDYVISEFHKHYPFEILKLDFQKMKDDGIDAVELLDGSIGHEFINNLEMSFNGWDCDSIVVLNPSKIVFLN